MAQAVTTQELFDQVEVPIPTDMWGSRRHSRTLPISISSRRKNATNRGFVPSYGGKTKTWRLHQGKDAKIVYEWVRATVNEN